VVDHAVDVEGSLVDLFAQAAPLDVGHGDIVPALELVDFVNRADIRMIQRRRRPGLGCEALPVVFGGYRFRRQEFQRDGPVQLRVLGLVHHTHATLAELPGDLVVRDNLADHCSSSCEPPSFPQR
jgi:hypothetical protein